MMNDKRSETRLFVEALQKPVMVLDDHETLGVVRVMRLKAGQQVSVFCGDGTESRYEVQAVSRNELVLEWIETVGGSCEPGRSLTVWLAATKGKTKDRMVRDLVALGVTTLVVYTAERSVSRPETDLVARMRKIAIEACRQCGRCSLPEVLVEERGLEALRAEGALVFFDETRAQAPLPESVADAEACHVVFGPEGGFTDAERSFLQERGALAAGLGKRILRAELAAAVGVALVQQRRGEMA